MRVCQNDYMEPWLGLLSISGCKMPVIDKTIFLTFKFLFACIHHSTAYKPVLEQCLHVSDTVKIGFCKRGA